MPENDDQGQEASTGGSTSRRKYLAAMAAASIGLSGCGGNGGSTATPTDTSEPTPTPTDVTGPGETPTEDTGQGTTPTEETGRTPTPTEEPQEPVTDKITSYVTILPQGANFNPWAATVKDDGINWWREQDSPYFAPEDRDLFSGHTWKTPWIDDHDEVSVLTWIKDYEVNPPYEVTEIYDERTSYWDGTSVTAETHYLHDRLWYLNDGGPFSKSNTFNGEQVGKWKYKYWRDKGNAPGQESDPANRFLLRQMVGTAIPFHPKFTRPWVQKFEDASTKKRSDSLSNDLASVKINYYDYAEQDYGSGLYRIRSKDNISEQRILAHKRDDHPHSDHATIPKLEMLITTGDRFQVLAQQGKIDLRNGMIQTGQGEFTREMMPDYIQEIERFLTHTGDQLVFNWNNKHLGRLWVRRAIVAALDFIQIGINGWGSERSVPARHHVGMPDTAAKGNFSEEFLNKLYTYPIESDMELASEWMEKAGYTKLGGKWVGPDGDELSVAWKLVTEITTWVGAAQTVKSQLEDFGAGVNFQGQNWPGYIDSMKKVDYDISMQWTHSGFDPWKFYDTDGRWWTNPLISGPRTGDGFRVSRDAKMDEQGMPLEVEIPREIGSIEAPDRAGKNPSVPNGQKIDLAKLVYRLREPGLTEKELKSIARKCARFYNYYLPDYIIHQYADGYWGNVKEFRFPPENHGANLTGGDWRDTYQVLAGTAHVKYDPSYPEPK